MATRAGTIHVLTPDIPFAVGGVRQHYQLVETLRGAGLPAVIVHRGEGFRCRWFDNDTPVVCASQTTVTERDLVVFPEEMIGLVTNMAPGVPKIIFNQNAYTTFLWGVSVVDTQAAYRHPDVWSTVLVSDDNVEYMKRAFPGLRHDRLRYAIDSRLFHPDDVKRRTVSYMPRKRKAECEELLALLRVTGALDGWELLPIDGVGEEKAAELLRASSVFLSFSWREGFGLPPAEAMASGCVVVGFDGFAGREFMRDHALSVPDGDVQAYAQIAGDVLRSWDQRRSRFETMATEAASFIAQTYSFDAHRRSVVPLFEEAMSAPRARRGDGRLEVPPFGPSRWRRVGHQLKRAVEAAAVRRSLGESARHLSSACSLIVRGND